MLKDYLLLRGPHTARNMARVHTTLATARLMQVATTLLLALALFLGNAQTANAQQFFDPSSDDANYDTRKQQQVPARSNESNSTPRAVNSVGVPSCFEAFSNTGADGWTALPRNDDGFVGPISLGFNFSLFGSTYSSVYINNNGNVTFNNGVSQYSPDGFPTTTPMVAAFWGDVDTRNTSSGRVWYKIFGDRLVVTWDRVGYFDSRVDKTNTFQLTIRANTAPGFTGDDVLFAYGDMQWTTGEASNGTNGFGGSPATVGLNRGNNVDFIQTGRFDKDGSSAPTLTTTGGVDFLDGKCLSYRALATGGNLPPIATGLPSNNLITLNQGESRTVAVGFTGPETNQTINVSSSLGSLCNAVATVANNNTQNPVLTFEVTGGTCNIGTNTVILTATDSGTPTAATASFTLTIVVSAPVSSTVNLPPVAPSIPDQSAVVGTPATQVIPPFTDPNSGQSITYSAAGLPPGCVYVGGTITGTPTTAGVYSVTITGTDVANETLTGGLSANAIYTITVSSSASPGGSFQLIAPTYDCATGAFTFNTTGGDGTPITFSAVGICAPRVSNTSSLVDDVDGQLAQDIRDQKPNVQPMLLQATQSGITVTYTWDALAACGTTTPPPPPPVSTTSCGSPSNTIGQPLALVAPTYDCATRAIKFNSTGGDGSPILFSAIGICVPTTSCTDNLDPGNTDNNTYTIQAQQGATIVTLSWTRPCASLRQGVEPGADLSVSVLGNPVSGDVVEFDVIGAEGQTLRSAVMDGQGRILSERAIQQAGAIERQSLRLGRSAGVYFLNVSTGSKTTTVKVLKQ